MAFDYLPNEILKEILAYTRLEDFESFCLSCRPAYAVSEPLLAEYNRFRRYIRFQYDKYDEHDEHTSLTDRIVCPHQLIHQIAQAPLIPHYVVDITLGERYHLREDTSGPSADIYDQVAQSIHVLLQQSDCFAMDRRSEWVMRNTIMEDCPHPEDVGFDPDSMVIEENRGLDLATTFLLTLLPRVQKVRFPRNWSHYSTYRFWDGIWEAFNCAISNPNGNDWATSAILLHEHPWGGQRAEWRLLVRGEHEHSSSVSSSEQRRPRVPALMATRTDIRNVHALIPILSLDYERDMVITKHEIIEFDRSWPTKDPHVIDLGTHEETVLKENNGHNAVLVKAPEALEKHFSFRTPLETLKLLYPNNGVQINPRWNLNAFTLGLQKGLGDELLCLSLNRREHVNKITRPLRCSLRGFKKLRELEINTRLFHDDRVEKTCDGHDIDLCVYGVDNNDVERNDYYNIWSDLVVESDEFDVDDSRKQSNTHELIRSHVNAKNTVNVDGQEHHNQEIQEDQTIPVDDGNTMRFVDILPPTLEKLRLLVHLSDDDAAWFERLFMDFAELRAERLPNLKEVAVVRGAWERKNELSNPKLPLPGSFRSTLQSEDVSFTDIEDVVRPKFTYTWSLDDCPY